MDRDTWLLITIASVLLVFVVSVVLFWRYREEGRPILKEVRVVTASANDPVFRDGARKLAPGETFRLAVALLVEQRGRGAYWISPAERLELDGAELDHLQIAGWPESDRVLRVHWFTIESSSLGGRLGSAGTGHQLEWRTFLAPELGRAPAVEGRMEAHNDDFVGGLAPPPPDRPGTLRFHARVEIVEKPADIRAVQTGSSPGVEALFDPRLPTVSRGLGAPEGIQATVGELFLLPGFRAPAGGRATADAIAVKATGRPLADLVAGRYVTTSWSVAVAAVAGDSILQREQLQRLGEVDAGPAALTRRGRRLSWGSDIQTGDLLETGEHWLVLERDDGNGYLDSGDQVLHCWQSPAEETTLVQAVDPGTTRLRLFRYEH